MILALLLACAPRAPVAPATPHLAEVVLDFAPLYGGVSSSSIVDRPLAEPGLLARVRVERGTLDLFADDTGLEGWTQGLLLGTLVGMGSSVVGPPWAEADPISEVPAPTAWLGGVHFTSGSQAAEVVVPLPMADGRVAVSLRTSKDEQSVCPADFSLDVAFVELHAVLLRAPDRAVVAVWHEVGVLDVAADLSRPGALPDPQSSPAAFCDSVRTVHEGSVKPELTGADYERTGQAVLRLALGQLTRTGVGLPELVAPPAP